MLIGIEHEVGVLDQQRSLQKALGTTRPSEQYNIYKEVERGLYVAYDKEYYNTQYEVKFRGFEPTEENIAAVSEYFGTLYGKNDTIQNKGPDFVGTHIHLFNSYGPNDIGILQVIERTFAEMAGFWHKYYEDDRIAHIYKLYELKRLSTSNNLLKFLDHNVFGGHLKSILETSGQSYQYRDIGFDKPKYSPVIWSPARGGKEYSLELRYISNTYFLLEDPTKIKKLIDDCQEIVNNATINPNRDITFYRHLSNLIFKHYLTITQLSYGIQNNMSLRHVEDRIRELIPLVSIKYTEDRLRLISQVNLKLISDGDLFARNHPERNREERDSNSNSSDTFYNEDESSDDTDGESEEGS